MSLWETKKKEEWWGWCIECLCKHAIALQGHLEEGVTQASTEGNIERIKKLSQWLTQIRKMRKEWLKEFMIREVISMLKKKKKRFKLW